MKYYRIINSYLAIFCGLFLLIGSVNVTAKAVVNEASRVVNSIIQQGESTGGTIGSFYKEFNTSAAKLTELEAHVDGWKQKGHLCETYEQCPEKWDLVYAYSSQIMGNIQTSFNKNRDNMLQALRSFSKAVYEGKDNISDQRNEELATLPIKVSRLREANSSLREERSRAQEMCNDNSSTKCKRLFNQLSRKAKRINRELQRLVFTRKIAELRGSLVGKLDSVLDNYTDMEANAVSMMANYAFIFEQYSDINGAGGLGNLMNAIKELNALDKKLSNMDTISKGLQQSLIGMGETLNARLAELNGKDLSTESRSKALQSSSRILDSNDSIMAQLENELNQ
ncbi:MAG: hypothetical protein ABW168_08240 [Sedimenticola sp.]